jgi:hypothetical protein
MMLLGHYWTMSINDNMADKIIMNESMDYDTNGRMMNNNIIMVYYNCSRPLM